jgi:hypothetical protein
VVNVEVSEGHDNKGERRIFFRTTPLKTDKFHHIGKKKVVFMLGGKKIKLCVNKNGYISLRCAGEKFLLGEANGDEGKTVIRFRKKDYTLATNASWTALETTRSGVEFKSRMVEEQTNISDAKDYHLAPIEEVTFRNIMMMPVGQEQKKIRKYSPRNSEEYSFANPEAVAGIRAAEKAIVYGDCSLVTSLLPNLMTEGIPQAIARRTDIPRIFIFKIMQDTESKGLSVMQQVELIENTVRRSTSFKSFKFEDICDYLVIFDHQEIDTTTYWKFQELKEGQRKNLEQPATQEKMISGELKYSKIAPEDPVEFDKEALNEKVAARGIKIYFVEASDIKLSADSGKYQYKEENLIRIIREIEKDFRSADGGMSLISIWMEAVGLYARHQPLEPQELKSFLELLQRFGPEAKSMEGRAVLSALAQSRVELKPSIEGLGYVFVRNNKRLSGVRLNGKGLFEMDAWVRSGMKIIRKGAIAADMDYTTAPRNEVEFPLISDYKNQLLLYGILYGVISANEIGKQMKRSSLDRTG